MLLAISTFTLVGILGGFALWFGLLIAVFRWGPRHEEPPQAQKPARHDKSAPPPEPPYGSR